MIDKKLYIQLKKEVRCLCRKNLLKMCEDMELNNFEKDLLLDFYDNKTVVEICMKHNINKNSYIRYLKNIFNKVYDYKNTQF